MINFIFEISLVKRQVMVRVRTMQLNRKLFLVSFILLVSCQARRILQVSKMENRQFVSDIPFHPLRNKNDLDVLLQAIDSRIVLLGEATHGTSEFYTWRTEITKRLIMRRVFAASP